MGSSPLNILAAIFVLAHIGLFAFSVWRVRYLESRVRFYWLIALEILALLITCFLLLPPTLFNNLPLITLDWVLLVTAMALTSAYAGVVLLDITRAQRIPQFHPRYLVGVAIWLVIFVLLTVVQGVPVAGWMRWLSLGFTLAGLVGVFGIVMLSMITLLATLYYYYKSPMPEIANRTAFRAVVTAIYLISVVMLTSGSDALTIPGGLVLLVALLNTVYASYYYRVFDVRVTLLRSVRILLIAVSTWAITFFTIYFFGKAEIPLDFVGTMLIVILALIVSVVVIPTRQAIEVLFGQIEMQASSNLAKATAEYTQRVALAASLEEVVSVTTETLNRVMGVRRSALILINNTFRVQDAVELIVMESGSSFSKPTSTGYVGKSSPIYKTLAVNHVPLTQYDIEYGAVYQGIIQTERAFFRQMSMSAYVPILSESTVIGLLACGPKSNDTPYSRDDMEMLIVIGQQVGTALRSARLIDDLQHLNNSMRQLNKRLENAKTELEKLDSVKTDFITIASHELRTPLAQIRGYTDIIDSMNDQGLLKPGQMTQLVQNLRKSTERMEELISNMLDVSQIDVNALDFRFVRTTPEAVVRMAIEPLKEVLEQRKQTIERSGFQGLPHIQADMQRMVQAFRNLIVNAIKFTPDGGKIEITAKLEPAEHEGAVDIIVFAIKDTGVGIAKKDIELIFQKFYRGFDTQLHSTGMYKFMGAGPGLGLTIARGVITGHGGKVWAESPGHDMKTNPGSVFYVRLPVIPPSGTRRVLPFDSEEVNPMTRPAAAPSTAHMQRLQMGSGANIGRSETATEIDQGEGLNSMNTRLPRNLP